MSLYREESSIYWWCRFQVNGTPYRISTGKTNKREAKDEEHRLRAEKRAEAGPQRRGVGTLVDLCGLDIDRAISEGADPESAKHTLESRWTPLCKFFGPDYTIDQLTTLEMERYVLARRNWPYQKTPKHPEVLRRTAGQTIRREIAALRRGCIMAKKRGWIDRLPDEFPRLRKDPKNKAMSGKLRSTDVLQELFDEAGDRRSKTKESAVRDHVLFAVLTGLRAEELPNVRLEWVEYLPPATYEVPALLRLPEDATKTGDSRFVGLAQEALDIIHHRAKQAAGGVLFPHKSIGQWLRRYSKVRDISPAITLRDLRHTFSTLGMQKTSDATAVQNAMGHTDLKTTQIYQSATIARITAVSAAVASVVVRPKLSDTELSRRAVRDLNPRPSASETNAFAENISFSRAKHDESIQENTSSCQTILSDTPVRLLEYRRLKVMCEKCGRISELEEAPTYECVYCGAQAFPLAEPIQDVKLDVGGTPHVHHPLLCSAIDGCVRADDTSRSRCVGKGTE